MYLNSGWRKDDTGISSTELRRKRILFNKGLASSLTTEITSCTNFLDLQNI